MDAYSNLRHIRLLKPPRSRSIRCPQGSGCRGHFASRPPPRRSSGLEEQFGGQLFERRPGGIYVYPARPHRCRTAAERVAGTAAPGSRDARRPSARSGRGSGRNISRTPHHHRASAGAGGVLRGPAVSRRPRARSDQAEPSVPSAPRARSSVSQGSAFFRGPPAHRATDQGRAHAGQFREPCP